MSYDDDGIAGGDDDDKLIPEWGRSADEQIIWFALGVLAILALLFFGASRCGAVDSVADRVGLGGSDDTSDLTIGEVFEGDRDLSASADFFALTDLDRDFGRSNGGPFTVLAPNDDAWENAADLGGVDVDTLLEAIEDGADEGAGFHVIEGEFTLDELLDEGTVTTIGGHELTFADDLIDGQVEITDADLEAENGIVHVIDTVLPVVAAVTPEPEPTATPEPEPTATPEPEPTPEPTATPVPEPTSTPEPEPTATPEPEPTPVPEPDPVTIGSLAGETGDLSTLSALVAQLGLDGVLADPDAGPFTVFAPDNVAFDAAAGVLAGLDENDQVETVGYHVVPRLVPASEVVAGAEFETLSGNILRIGSDGSLPGGVSVQTADLLTDNGIVHVIDGVLIPTRIQLRGLNVAIADLEGIQFDVSSANIRAESVPILEQAASVLRTLPEGTAIEVAGHTDSDGDAASNLALSQARAESVVAWLVDAGVDAELLTPVGYGETELKVEPESTPADKQANRRIEFNSGS